MRPIPEVTDADMAFPCRHNELLPAWKELTEEQKRNRDPFSEALQSLFFNGGKLSDHGIRMKDGVDGTKVNRFIQATLGDWGPKHEHKIGGIAHCLADWCEIETKPKQE